VLGLLLFLMAFLVVGVLAVKVLFGLILLPFRLVGGLARLLVGVVGGLVGLAFSVVGIVLAVVFGVILLPLAPLILLGGLFWLAFRAGRHGVARAV